MTSRRVIHTVVCRALLQLSAAAKVEDDKQTVLMTKAKLEGDDLTAGRMLGIAKPRDYPLKE